MVERIIAAGREVLLRDGYDAFSTNRIAGQAGISPGSLYQYFPNKDAIIDAVLEQYGDDLADRVAAALGDRLGDTGPRMSRDTADALLTALEKDVGLLWVSTEELPATRHGDRLTALERRVQELCVAYLAGRKDLLRSSDHATSACAHRTPDPPAHQRLDVHDEHAQRTGAGRRQRPQRRER